MRNAEERQAAIVDIGGIPVHALKDMNDALAQIFDERGCKPGYAVAINPEKIVLAQENERIRKYLESATLRSPDGIGVVFTMRSKGVRARRIPGVELWEHAMGVAAKTGTKVFLVGAKPEVMAAVDAGLKSQYPGLQLVGTQHGYFSENDREPLFQGIIESGAQFVAVALGSPRQEAFIAELRQRHPGAFYMGVGGSFDVFAGHVMRAPPLARRLHAEWLYRLLSEPRRVWRQRRLAVFALKFALRRL